MISVPEAKKIIVKNTKSLNSYRVAVAEAVGFVLSEDIHSPLNLPPFPQSAMDGYAIRHDDLSVFQNRLKLIGETAAGKTANKYLNSGETIRIFTGAAVPEGASAVVMQEKITKEGEIIYFQDTSIQQGSNIRPTGAEIKKGAIALEKGTVLNAAGVGFLNAMGIQEVEVYRKPKISILVTGDELVQPGRKLEYGQIYESNSSTLQAALVNADFDSATVVTIEDNYESTVETIRNEFQNSDVLILSGGISVGDYDFVERALKELGTEELFYKIKQKPGKPMFYGKNTNISVFALPGNPASLLCCFYEYVLPALRKMSGQQELFLDSRQLPLSTDYIKKGDRAQFLKGKAIDKSVTLLEGQSSFIMQSFAQANCLIYVPENVNEISKGELVEVHYLP